MARKLQPSLPLSGSTAVYPAREPYYAIKLLWDFHASGTVARLGPLAYGLLTAVAVQEDRLRYRGPVGYWNTQLMESLSLTTRQFTLTRANLVESGWLHYENRNRAPGLYWTLNPAPSGIELRSNDVRVAPGAMQTSSERHSNVIPPVLSLPLNPIPLPQQQGGGVDKDSEEGEPLEELLRRLGIVSAGSTLKRALAAGYTPESIRRVCAGFTARSLSRAEGASGLPWRPGLLVVRLIDSSRVASDPFDWSTWAKPVEGWQAAWDHQQRQAKELRIKEQQAAADSATKAAAEAAAAGQRSELQQLEFNWGQTLDEMPTQQPERLGDLLATLGHFHKQQAQHQLTHEGRLKGAVRTAVLRLLSGL